MRDASPSGSRTTGSNSRREAPSSPNVDGAQGDARHRRSATLLLRGRTSVGDTTCDVEVTMNDGTHRVTYADASQEMVAACSSDLEVALTVVSRGARRTGADMRPTDWARLADEVGDDMTLERRRALRNERHVLLHVQVGECLVTLRTTNDGYLVSIDGGPGYAPCWAGPDLAHLLRLIDGLRRKETSEVGRLGVAMPSHDLPVDVGVARRRSA